MRDLYDSNLRIYIVLLIPKMVFHRKSQDIFDLRDDGRRREAQAT
jgi:hypothetical protein